MEAMGKLLDLEEDYFLKPDLIHGLKPHYDDSGITILLPDQTVEGLEVCKDGKWVEVNALPYALIINAGDQMEVMSNGMFKSPVHRAVANSVEDIISLVMFLVANVEKEIRPADGLIDEENGKPRLHKRFKAKEYRDVIKCMTNVEECLQKTLEEKVLADGSVSNRPSKRGPIGDAATTSVSEMMFGKKFPKNNQEMGKVPDKFGDGRAARFKSLQMIVVNVRDGLVEGSPCEQGPD
ncbi:hypothetical protein ACLOJK_027633 [Asimina triloba]